MAEMRANIAKMTAKTAPGSSWRGPAGVCARALLLLESPGEAVEGVPGRSGRVKWHRRPPDRWVSPHMLENTVNLQ